jgi:hypothetical protein
MAKLNESDVAKTNIVRATYENNMWVVLVNDTDGIIYRVEFNGDENEPDSSILAKTKVELMKLDRIEKPVVVEPKRRDTVVGLAPKDNND